MVKTAATMLPMLGQRAAQKRSCVSRWCVSSSSDEDDEGGEDSVRVQRPSSEVDEEEDDRIRAGRLLSEEDSSFAFDLMFSAGGGVLMVARKTV